MLRQSDRLLLQFEVKFYFFLPRSSYTVIFNFDKSKSPTKEEIFKTFANTLDDEEWKELNRLRVVNSRYPLKCYDYNKAKIISYRSGFEQYHDYAVKYLPDMNYSIYKYLTIILDKKANGKTKKKSLLTFLVDSK